MPAKQVINTAIEFKNFKAKDLTLPYDVNAVTPTGKPVVLAKGSRVFVTGSAKINRLYAVLDLANVLVVHVPFDNMPGLVGVSPAVRKARKAMRLEFAKMPALTNLAAAMKLVEASADADDLTDYFAQYANSVATLNQDLYLARRAEEPDAYRVGQLARKFSAVVSQPRRLLRDLKSVNADIMTGGLVAEMDDEDEDEDADGSDDDNDTDGDDN